MPMLKKDETVVCRGFAATCKTKCVDLEDDELYKYCLAHCHRPVGWIDKKPFDQQEWEIKTMKNVEKNRELYMQNFCYCDYQLTSPDQIAVPFLLPDKNEISVGERPFDRNFKSSYKVDEIVIEDEDGSMHLIKVVNKAVAKLNHIPNDYDRQNLRQLILVSTGTFENPIQINIAAAIIRSKIIVASYLRSSHKINLVEVRLSEIKERK